MNFPSTYINSVNEGTKFQKAYKVWAGKGTLQYKEHLKSLIQKHNVKTVLDFGCGKGVQYSIHKIDQELGFEVVAYDPCIHGLKNWPVGKWDMVIALDCLSLVNKSDLPWIYSCLDNWADKCVLVATQIGYEGKENKKVSASGVELYTDINDFINPIPRGQQDKFYIVNHLEFIHNNPI